MEKKFQPQPNKNNNRDKKLSILGWVLIFAMVLLFSWYMPMRQKDTIILPYSDLNQQISAGKVVEVTMKGGAVSGKLKDGKNFQSYAPEDSGIVSLLKDNGVKITAQPKDNENTSMGAMLISWLPMILFVGIFFDHSLFLLSFAYSPSFS